MPTWKINETPEDRGAQAKPGIKASIFYRFCLKVRQTNMI